MVLRWAAAAYLETEQHFRKIIGYRDRWMLQAIQGRQGGAPGAGPGRLKLEGKRKLSQLSTKSGTPSQANAVSQSTMSTGKTCFVTVARPKQKVSEAQTTHPDTR